MSRARDEFLLGLKRIEMKDLPMKIQEKPWICVFLSFSVKAALILLTLSSSMIVLRTGTLIDCSWLEIGFIFKMEADLLLLKAATKVSFSFPSP